MTARNAAGKRSIGLRRGDVLVLGLILALAAALFFADRPRGDTVSAVIYADGEAVRTIDLSAVGAPYACTVGGCTFSVRRGAIAFSAADCPDKLCVRRGEMTHASDCMACVPMRVAVVLTGGGGADAVTG